MKPGVVVLRLLYQVLKCRKHDWNRGHAGMACNAAKPTPANSAPPMRPIPPTTPSMKIGRPCVKLQSVDDVVEFTMPNYAPPSPAIPAESANTASFVLVRFIPTVAHAASLSFIASSRRPIELAADPHDERAREHEQDRAEHHLFLLGVEAQPEQIERGHRDRAGAEERHGLMGAEDVERRELPHPLVHEHGKCCSGEREIDARQAQRWESDERADDHAEHDRPDDAHRAPAAAEVGERDGADTGERELARGDTCPARPIKGTSESTTMATANSFDALMALLFVISGRARNVPPTTMAENIATPCHVGIGEELGAQVRPLRPQPAARQQREQHDEEHDHRRHAGANVDQYTLLVGRYPDR